MGTARGNVVAVCPFQRRRGLLRRRRE
jgi:hypothetical protein